MSKANEPTKKAPPVPPQVFQPKCLKELTTAACIKPLMNRPCSDILKTGLPDAVVKMLHEEIHRVYEKDAEEKLEKEVDREVDWVMSNIFASTSFGVLVGNLSNMYRS